MYSLGAKLLVVCAGPRQPRINRQQFLRHWHLLVFSASPPDTNHDMFAEESLLLSYISTSRFGLTNEGRESITCSSNDFPSTKSVGFLARAQIDQWRSKWNMSILPYLGGSIPMVKIASVSRERQRRKVETIFLVFHLRHTSKSKDWKVN